MLRRFLMSACVLCAMLGAEAHAQELIAGWEGGPSNGYAFFEPVFTMPKADTTSAFVIRPALGYLYYDFPEAGGITSVSSPGASLGVAYRLRTPRLTFTIGPGFEYRKDQRRLADGTNTEKTETGATVAADAYFQENPLTALSAIATYGDANHYVWSRAGIKRQVTNRDFKGSNSLSLGVEVTGQGNNESKQVQGGGLFEWGLPQERSSVQLRAGISRVRYSDNSTERRKYFGIGFYRAY